MEQNAEILKNAISGSLKIIEQEREKEIIKIGYEKWGRKVGEHIYGMFAFALRDDEENKIFAVRDQFGTKPFYYYVTEDSQLLEKARRLAEKEFAGITDKSGVDYFKGHLSSDVL